MVNANILLVPKEVVDKIGIFYTGYRHGNADYDYGVIARKAGYPVVITSHFCGIADNDHVDHNRQIAEKVLSMTLKERKKWFDHPLHSNRDYMCFVRRVSPLRYPMVWFGELLRLYIPSVYYELNGIRK